MVEIGTNFDSNENKMFRVYKSCIRRFRTTVGSNYTTQKDQVAQITGKFKKSSSKNITGESGLWAR